MDGLKIPHNLKIYKKNIGEFTKVIIAAKVKIRQSHRRNLPESERLQVPDQRALRRSYVDDEWSMTTICYL